jgi:Myb-like DNA-binding domain
VASAAQKQHQSSTEKLAFVRCTQADEELLLLEALDMYGLGNWGAVGEHVNRGAAECAAHYERIYLRSPAFLEPTPAPEMAGVRTAFPFAPPQRMDFGVLPSRFVFLSFLLLSSSYPPLDVPGWRSPCIHSEPTPTEAVHARRPVPSPTSSCHNCCRLTRRRGSGSGSARGRSPASRSHSLSHARKRTAEQQALVASRPRLSLPRRHSSQMEWLLGVLAMRGCQAIRQHRVGRTALALSRRS